MYTIPERTEGQQQHWKNVRFEEWKQDERQRRIKVLSRVVIRKDADGYRVVYYKDNFICCLFDNDKYENERMIRIIVNLIEAINE